MIKYILLFASVLVLQGCPKEEIIVTEYVDKPIYVPETFLEDCDISKPPTKEEFMKLNVLGRQTALTKYITQLLKDLKACNIKINSIREWNNKQKEIYDPNPKEEKR